MLPLTLPLIAQSDLVTNYTVTTLAGNGSQAFANGTGTNATISEATGVAVDGSGNLYVAHPNYIRKITSNGLVTTVAGNGFNGFANGVGTNATFRSPYGVAVDGSGNVYVADTGNHVIRKIDASGNVTTFAGVGIEGFSNGTRTNALFRNPQGVAVDGTGNVYVADMGNHVIRKIDANGNVTTHAGRAYFYGSTKNGEGISGFWNGNGTNALFQTPRGVAVDGSGNVYIADTGNNAIRKIDTSGNVTTLEGYGPNGNGIGPYGVAVDGFGNVYVAGGHVNAIRKIDASGNVSYIAGEGSRGFKNGSGENATFYWPSGVAVDGTGNVYVADWGNNAIRKLIPSISTRPRPTGTNTITFPALGSMTYSNGLSLGLGATASSGLQLSYSSPSSNVSISGTNVRVLGAGTATIVASQAGNSYYAAAAPVTNFLVIAKGAAEVSIRSNSLTEQTYDGWSKSLGFDTVPSGLALSMTYNGSTKRPVSPGTYEVVASVTDPNYEGGASATATLTIAKGVNEITFRAPSPVVAGSSPFPLTATASSGLLVAFRSTSTNISLRGGLVTVLGAGTATITASQTGNTFYDAATEVTRQLVVTGAAPSVVSIAGIAARNFTPQIPTRQNTFPLARPTNAGSLVAWGDASYGQTNIPAGLTNVVQLSARGLHTLALRTNGTIAAWGWNAHRQTNVPASATNAVQVAAGVNFSAALRADGTVVAWGNNNYAQTNVPAGLANVVQIAAGSDHGLALRRDGTVAAWGWNAYGQTNIPASATNVVQVAAGYFHSVALRANGTVVAWGDNTYGETNVPAGLTNVVMIATGLNHTVALRRDGTVAAWGWNNAGQTNVPAGLTGISQIASGGNTVYAVTTNGALVTWGDNSYGQRRPPAGLTGVYQFVLGLYHGVGLRK